MSNFSRTVSRNDWSLTDEVTYLNHGSFGPPPRAVQQARETWTARLNANPMDFFLRQFDGEITQAADRLAGLVGADARDLVFVDNSTMAMNVVARSLNLAPGDEILLNDHEYGAVFRIWRRVCDETGARIVSPALGQGDDQAPRQFQDRADITSPILAAITPRTRLIVVSHITSATAIKFPVEELCREARLRSIPICIDGPHAIAMQPVNLKQIACDFYCASLHKWLSAPFGSGFLFVDRRRQADLKVPITSWGRSLGGKPARWQDELNWLGTRDPAAYLAVPAAIDFLEEAGWDNFRQSTHEMARYARQQLEPVLGQAATIPDEFDWYGSMTAIPLPPDASRKSRPNAIHPLQQALWDQHRIEVLVTECHGHRYLRVSCHLYTSRTDIDRLTQAVAGLIEA